MCVVYLGEDLYGNKEGAARERRGWERVCVVYLGEDLLGEVVDELPVDETADAVVNDLLALRVGGPWSIQGTTREAKGTKVRQAQCYDCETSGRGRRIL